MDTTITHQAIKLNWIKPSQIESPQTLVLGSFNPYNPDGTKVDYYYGRHTNHFWRTIAIIIGEEENYFFDQKNGFDRKLSIMRGRFACLDVINSIDFNSQNESSVRTFLNKKVFSNFADQNIWVRKTNISGQFPITLTRNYNDIILQTLEDQNTIKRIIHTMGSTRISSHSASPKENTLGTKGFNSFINKIREICKRKGIEFVTTSFSPSDYAVKNGGTNKIDLRKWLEFNLWFVK